jgi:hypothetical protein
MKTAWFPYAVGADPKKPFGFRLTVFDHQPIAAAGQCDDQMD